MAESDTSSSACRQLYDRVQAQRVRLLVSYRASPRRENIRTAVGQEPFCTIRLSFEETGGKQTGDGRAAADVDARRMR